MDPTQVQTALRDFILNDIIRDPAHPLDASTPLMDSGIIESLSLVALLGFIQSRFNIRVPDRDILPKNFQDLTALTQMVMRLPQDEAA